MTILTTPVPVKATWQGSQVNTPRLQTTESGALTAVKGYHIAYKFPVLAIIIVVCVYSARNVRSSPDDPSSMVCWLLVIPACLILFSLDLILC